MEKFEVHILGCGSALPTTRHNATSQVIDLRDKLYMIDCGEGTQSQYRRVGLSFSRLGHIFISHLHGDHCFGLFPLIATLGLEGKRTPLDIYAPAPMGDILDYHRRYFWDDLPYEVKWHEVRTTEHAIVMENNTLEVWSIPLRHRVPTAGYLFKEKQPGLNVDKFKIEKYGLSIAQIVAAKRGEDITLDNGTTIANEELTYIPYAARSYAYLSDTTYSAKAASLVKGVDLLYHETTYSIKDATVARGRGHSTTAEAAKVALKAEAKRLIIGHFSSRYKDYEELREECRAIFPNSDIAAEGVTFSINEER